jgi:hypothetical protein
MGKKGSNAAVPPPALSYHGLSVGTGIWQGTAHTVLVPGLTVSGQVGPDGDDGRGIIGASTGVTQVIPKGDLTHTAFVVGSAEQRYSTDMLVTTPSANGAASRNCTLHMLVAKMVDRLKHYNTVGYKVLSSKRHHRFAHHRVQYTATRSLRLALSNSSR